MSVLGSMHGDMRESTIGGAFKGSIGGSSSSTSSEDTILGGEYLLRTGGDTCEWALTVDDSGCRHSVLDGNLSL